MPLHGSSSECVVLSGFRSAFRSAFFCATNGEWHHPPGLNTSTARHRCAECGAPNAAALWIPGGASEWRCHGYCVEGHATGCNVATALCNVLALEPACFHPSAAISHFSHRVRVLFIASSSDDDMECRCHWCCNGVQWCSDQVPGSTNCC